MLTAFLIFWPLIAALLVFALRPANARNISFAAALIEFVVSVYAIACFEKNGSIQFAMNVPWITSIGINFAVGMDGISILLVLLTTFLVPLIILTSNNRPYSFYGLILIMQMALVGVFTALDGFLFYIFWEMALIPIYFICLIWGGNGSGRITLKFFIYTLAGSLFMLAGLVYLYFQTPDQSFAIQSLYDAGRELPMNEQTIIFWLFFVAFAIKMPVFPFHTWQPDTYTVSPTEGTMLLSGIMLKMGIFGLIRWLIPVVPVAAYNQSMIAITLSVIGIVYASCIAIVQKDIKRLVAFSSIAHVGLISAGMLTLTRMGYQGAIIQMLSHGIVVFGLFYVIEIISERTKTRVISELGGIRTVAPVFTTVFMVIMLGSIALPFTSGFVGEFLLINTLFQYKAVLGAVGALTTILGAVYMLRAFQKTMTGETSKVTEIFADLTLREKIALYPIVILVVVIGIYPAPLMSISEPAVNNLFMVLNEFLHP